MIRSTLSLVLVAILLLGASQASAGCGPFANTLYVGNTAIDNECDYDTIQAAIDAAVCPATIVITTQRTWSGQHLNITDKSLTLSGRASGGCGDVINPGLAAPTMTTGTPPPDRVSLTGYDGLDQGIIHVSGNSHVTLRNLTISGGGDVAYSVQRGGGVGFVGYGSLTLENVAVSDNYARSGGGIYVNGLGGRAELHLRANTQVYFNTAQYSGGGIAIVHDTRLLMTEPGSSIAFNEAIGLTSTGSEYGGAGGGLYILGAQADIGSPGLLSESGDVLLAAVSNNAARWGGGIAVESTVGSSKELLRVFSTGDGAPTAIQANVAHRDGGALILIYGGNACLFNTNLLDNSAETGAAIKQTGGGLYFNSDPNDVCDEADLPALGATPCPTGQVCNLVTGNDTVDAGLANPGAVFSLNYGSFYANRLSLTNNTADYGIVAVGADDTAFLRNCLIANNDFEYDSIEMIGRLASLDHCTFANNGLSSSQNEISTNSDISLTRSIVFEPAGVTTLDVESGEANVLVQHVLSSDLSTLPTRSDIITGDPKFVDSAVGIYQLQADSPALDFAPGSDGKDLAFRPRKVDLNYNANDFGPSDLGAYERQLPGAVTDTLFLDGFELCFFCKGRTP